jgi:hypothetical protein
LKEINTDFNIDQFVETEIELWALSEYLDALEKYLPFMKKQERLKTNAWLKRKSSELDESDIDITLHQLQDLVDHILPRFFRSPFLVSDFEGKRMIVNYFGHSGNDLKSGKLSSGMGGRFRPESTLNSLF